MKALQLTQWQSPPVLVDVADPVPGPGQVLLKVAGAGLCASDLKLMAWPGNAVPYSLPFTLGHETSGWVVSCGDQKPRLETGTPVVVYGAWGCGMCWHCCQGMDNVCEGASDRGAHGGGLGVDGGLAEYLIVPDTRYLVELHDLDPVASAPLADAALTPYHAIKPALPLLRPGTSAVVIGITGGLGHVAVQLLRAMTPARVVAVDPHPDARRLAHDLGAHGCVDGSDSTTILDEVGKAGATFIIDLVGSEHTLALVADVVSVDGDIAIVGLGGGVISVGFGRLPLESRVRVPNWGSRSELEEVVALARAGLIELRVERWGLHDAIRAYERLAAGNVVGRAVVTPNASAA